MSDYKINVIKDYSNRFMSEAEAIALHESKVSVKATYQGLDIYSYESTPPQLLLHIEWDNVKHWMNIFGATQPE